MAAYAALACLMNTVDNIQNHPRLSTCCDKKQTESLGQKIEFLLDLLENYSHGSSKEDLERQIISAAYAAEDVIETRVVDRILAESSEESCSFFMDLQEVIKDLDSVQEKVVQVIEEKRLQPKAYSLPASTSTGPVTTLNSSMVGFDDELIHLLDWLTGQQSSREVISIVGMAGIGKTTLARNAFVNSLTVHHFDVRAWVTVSQAYGLREILLLLLSSLENSEMDDKDDQQLGETLYKYLSGRRYLIIMDDIWNNEVWDNIKFFFPNNDNRSRIVVTTRLTNVAIHIGSLYLAINFLDEDKSWNLLCRKAFGREDCPRELEKMGKKIAKDCKGLPLAIVMIAGLLGNSDKTKEYWKDVAEDIRSFLNSGEDEQYLNIISLSYTGLPVHLKPCFLYMGVFPEDHPIRVSQLIKLWVAEGFLKSNKARSAEKVAEDYLKDLVDRNLLSVHTFRSNGKMKTCTMHDLVRDLCLRTVEKEKSLCVKSKLLKVLNLVGTDLRDGIFKHVNVRYISLNIATIPSSISLLWNVQTLICKRGGIKGMVAPPEIWKLTQLRHLQFDEIYLSDPPSDGANLEDDFVLRNLQTLSTIVDFRLSEEVCRRIPNVIKLHLKYYNFPYRSHYFCLYNIGCLDKLESLNCSFRKMPNRDEMLQNFVFPPFLHKLSLTNCCLHWEDLTMIGSLPHLEVLRLGWNSVTGHEWNPIEGEFRRLKYLSINACSELICWNADSSHFPVLENLILDSMYQLDEIPAGIGEIPTLRFIRLVYCSVSATISAMKILEEQESLGNEGLQVQVEIWDKEHLQTLRENVDQDIFKRKNFQLRDWC